MKADQHQGLRHDHPPEHGAALLAAAGAKPTAISTELGGSFTLFGGYITGRHIEMLPNERLVQAWRAGSWKAENSRLLAFI